MTRDTKGINTRQYEKRKVLIPQLQEIVNTLTKENADQLLTFGK